MAQVPDDKKEELKQRLIHKDMMYAEALDARQDEFLNKKIRLKNYQEFALVQKEKRTMLGLHTSEVKVDKSETHRFTADGEGVQCLLSLLDEFKEHQAKERCGKGVDAEKPILPH